uniref:Uncharacterized protein n=1 Tax=Avena sativa TaxID=4498 RepID=A0ACD5TR52_AVESA
MSGEAITRGTEEDEVAAVEGKADFRAWLLLLMSLAATVTYTAGLSPPGGVWSADNAAHGYVAGNPVMRDKSRTRYTAFYYGNSIAFFSSLMVIAMLAKPYNKSKIQHRVFSCCIIICFLSLGTSYIAGTAVDSRSAILSAVLIAAFMVITSLSMLSR